MAPSCLLRLPGDGGSSLYLFKWTLSAKLRALGYANFTGVDAIRVRVSAAGSAVLDVAILVPNPSMAGLANLGGLGGSPASAHDGLVDGAITARTSTRGRYETNKTSYLLPIADDEWV